ncbi:antifreeze glycopeptide AFGP polyprotein [Leifsonia xyli subsp. cynodontis DSM 46306]|uniref:Bacterial Ig-like domain-containing protein n=1 Tax=Leifsonia xyli subsp. cynodontis DSM 46306 TaxID=1389489 RepID=U3P3W6_LEIXC|nr:antifreeze glycopeptide AFGP polyprotein [Leifsonia xyli]AGW41000.1 antifreeze glycopeptide AFGP polyprotein [Leifsonia xyli subsp. cynodontis DSM 46306]
MGSFAAAPIALLLVAMALSAPTGPAAATTAVSPRSSTPTASAASADTATPSPTPTPSAPRLDPAPSDLVVSFPLTVSGTASPGDVIAVSGGSSPGADTSCTATADSDGRFSCALRRLPDGSRVPVRAESRATGLSDSWQAQVLSPPAITTADGTATGGGIRGTAFPGATVTVASETGAQCTFPADGAGTWGCVIGGMPDGRHTITATQVAPFSTTRSGRSASVSIVLDTVPPPAPTITAPRLGSSVANGGAFGFGGAGESGGEVTVYASTLSGTTVACVSPVTDGVWSCAGALPPGGYRVSALQRDAAGNVSAGSNTIAVTVQNAVATAPPSSRKPAAGPSPTPTPTVPAPAPPSDPERPDTKGWTETPFSTASAPAVDAASVPGWLRSLALAVAALLLLALPAQLLAAALARRRSRAASRPALPSVFGRNRTRAELAEADAVLGGQRWPRGSALSEASGLSVPATTAPQPLWLAPVVGVVAAALVTLSTSVQDAVAYIRLLFAVALAVAAVNAVGVLAARAMARHLGRSAPPVVVRPLLLMAVAATAVGSRLFGFEPALLFGLVVGVLLPDGRARVARGRIAAVQLCAIAALGVLAWLAVGVLPSPSGGVSAFLVEFANALSLLGIGSAAVALLPIGGLPGRAVFLWVRPLWLGLGLLVYTMLFALLLPVASLIRNGTGLVAILGAALVFAVLSVSVWLWERYIEPAR